MKVAVVSNDNQQSGKTTLSLLLANAYPSATGKESVYVTNGSLEEIIQLEKFTETTVAIERGIGIVTALSSTSNISDKEITNYAYRPTETNAMLFDIYSSTIGYEEAHYNFMSVVRQLGSRFIIMDLNGDVDSPEVKPLVEECDVILYIFRPIKKDINKTKLYLESLNEDERVKVKLVCNMWDTKGVSKKTIQDYMKIRSNSILWFPYHTNIQRTMFEGRLCVINRLMIKGTDNCLPLRQPIKDILSFVCDTSSIKVIREVSKWEK